MLLGTQCSGVNFLSNLLQKHLYFWYINIYVKTLKVGRMNLAKTKLKTVQFYIKFLK